MEVKAPTAGPGGATVVPVLRILIGVVLNHITKQAKRTSWRVGLQLTGAWPILPGINESHFKQLLQFESN